MKIVRRGVLPVGGDTGLDKMRTIALAGDFKTPAAPGERGTFPVLDGFTEKVLSIVDVDAIAPLKVVLDGANGMAGTMLSQVLPRLPIQAIPCYMEPDGTFPHHLPNPLLEENRAFIVGKVRDEGADLGIAWDGDADRCFFVDDEGEFVPGDFMTALLAEAALGEASRRDDPLRPACLPGRSRHDRALRRTAPCGRASAMPSSRCACARRTRSSPARCRATTTSATSTASTRASSRRCVLLELVSRKGGSLAEADPRRCARVPHLRRDQHARPRRRAEAAGAEGPVRRRRRGVAPRRRVDRLPRLALQRAAVQHRAAAAPEPRGLHRGRHGAPARRGAGGHQRVSDGCSSTRRARPTSRPPFRFSHTCGSGSTRPTRRASSTTAATCRTSTARGSSTCAHLEPAAHGARRPRVRDAREPRRVPRAGAVRRPARGVRARRAHRHARASSSSSRPATTTAASSAAPSRWSC